MVEDESSELHAKKSEQHKQIIKAMARDIISPVAILGKEFTQLTF